PQESVLGPRSYLCLERLQRAPGSRKPNLKRLRRLSGNSGEKQFHQRRHVNCHGETPEHDGKSFCRESSGEKRTTVWNSFFFSLKLFLKVVFYLAALGAASELGLLWRESKHHLQLHPHAADAAVGEIAIEEPAGGCAVHAHLRHVNKLWVIEHV